MKMSLTLSEGRTSVGMFSAIALLFLSLITTANAQNSAAKLEHVSFTINNGKDATKSVIFAEQILGATKVANDNSSSQDYELCPGGSIIKLFVKNTATTPTASTKIDINKWDNYLSKYGVAWIAFSTPDLNKTIEDLRRNNFPVKISKGVLPESPNTEVAITTAFDNQLVVLVQKNDDNQGFCKLEHVQLIVKNLKASVEFYQEAVGANDITYINEFVAEARIGDNTFLLAEPEGLVLDSANFKEETNNDNSVVKDNLSFLYADFEQTVYTIKGNGYNFKQMPVPQHKNNKHTYFSNGQIASPDGLIIEIGDIFASRFARQ